MENTEYTKQIVNNIYSQLGGKKFVAMTGTKVSYYSDKELQPVLCCKLTRDLDIKNRISQVLITYNIGKDLYKIDFINEKNKKTVKHYDDVYAEDLIPFFEQETGLLCFL